MANKSISHKADVIDSRNVIARIDDLGGSFQDAYDTFVEEYTGPGEALPDFDDWLTEISQADDHIDQDDAIELIELRKLATQCESYGSWSSGEELIRRRHFVRYIKEWSRSVNAVSDNDDWLYNHIDWDAAAAEREADYMEATFKGKTFLMRA